METRSFSPTESYLRYRFEDTPATARTFDELPLWSAPFGLLLLQHLELKRGMTVVDAGCGTGFPLLELAERLGSSAELYGVDTWGNALGRAQEKIAAYGIGNVTLIEGSARQLPFADDSVDLIVSNLGINNFDEPLLVLQECVRVLKEGGKLALTTNLNGHWQTFYTLFEETFFALGEAALIPALRAQQEHRGSVETVSELLQSAGLRITRQFTSSFDMSFLDGSAFLNHHFVKLGWLESWLSLVPEEKRPAVFAALEAALNRHSEQESVLRLRVPMAFIEGEKQPCP